MTRTDNERTTEREVEETHTIQVVNRNRHTTPMKRKCAPGGQTCNQWHVRCNSTEVRNSILWCLIKRGQQRVSGTQTIMNIKPLLLLYIIPIWKECGPKKVAQKEVIEHIIFGFGCHVLTSSPLKLQNLKLAQRTFFSSFRKISNAMAKLCAERRNRTRRLRLLVRCRNLWSNENLPEYAFQAYFLANLRTWRRKKCDWNF